MHRVNGHWLGKGLIHTKRSDKFSKIHTKRSDKFSKKIFASGFPQCEWALRVILRHTQKHSWLFLVSLHCICLPPLASPTPHHILCLQMTSLLIPCYQGKGNNYIRDSRVEFHPSPAISADIRHNLSQHRRFCGSRSLPLRNHKSQRRFYIGHFYKFDSGLICIPFSNALRLWGATITRLLGSESFTRWLESRRAWEQCYRIACHLSLSIGAEARRPLGIRVTFHYMTCHSTECFIVMVYLYLWTIFTDRKRR